MENYHLKKYYLLLIPILVEVVLELLKIKGIYIDKYVATVYQYNDVLREININDNIYSNLSEANYDNILGFSTTDYSQENVKKVLDEKFPDIKDNFYGDGFATKKIIEIIENNFA